MQRLTETFVVKNISEFKLKMLNWLQQFSIFCFLDSNNCKDDYHQYDCLVGANAVQIFNPEKDILSEVSTFYDQSNDWLFGHFNYHLKSETENADDNLSNHRIQFPQAFFFQPEILIAINNESVFIKTFTKNAALIFNAINTSAIEAIRNSCQFNFQNAFSKNDYLKTVEQLKHHIHIGDCYEINFCQEFYSVGAHINPFQAYAHLAEISPVPFSAFYRIDKYYLLCASPERFIAKRKDELTSQPIKGTAARSNNTIEDKQIAEDLRTSAKNKTENVMIVDLVRNDLSRVCKKNSVKVSKLFEVETYAQVHQMISTICGIADKNINFAEILRATFPMGSMTGAPKKKVIELIGKYERSRRGIFSGTVGYISPEKDFDFNVVIRSIMYDEQKKLLSYMVGSAITALSNAQDEYEECLVKAAAIQQVLQHQRLPEEEACESIT